jgi:hypothetical protein
MQGKNQMGMERARGEHEFGEDYKESSKRCVEI